MQDYNCNIYSWSENYYKYVNIHVVKWAEINTDVFCTFCTMVEGYKYTNLLNNQKHLLIIKDKLADSGLDPVKSWTQ